MGRIRLALLLFAALSIPLAAHAQNDLITLTGNGDTFTFLVPAMPSPTDDGPDAFILSAIPVTWNTGSGTHDESDLVYFYDTKDGGGLEDDSLLNPGILGLEGPVLYSGSITDPAFNVGTSGTLGTFTTSGAVAPFYSYSIAAVGAPIAPEPSSLLLFGTGLAVLGLFAAYRRRIHT